MPRYKTTKPKELKRIEDYPEVLTPAEAAALLRISQNALYSMIHAGTVPFFKIGSHFKLPKFKLAIMFGLISEPQNSDRN